MKNGDTNKILVIANKNDLYKNKDYSDFVEEDEGKEFAKEIGADFLSISLKNGDENKVLTYFEEKFKLNDFEDKKDINDINDIKDVNDLKDKINIKEEGSSYYCFFY